MDIRDIQKFERLNSDSGFIFAYEFDEDLNNDTNNDDDSDDELNSEKITENLQSRKTA